MTLQLCIQVIPPPGVGIPMGLALTLEAPSRRAGLPSWLCGQDLTMLPGHWGLTSWRGHGPLWPGGSSWWAGRALPEESPLEKKEK